MGWPEFGMVGMVGGGHGRTLLEPAGRGQARSWTPFKGALPGNRIAVIYACPYSNPPNLDFVLEGSHGMAVPARLHPRRLEALASTRRLHRWRSRV